MRLFETGRLSARAPFCCALPQCAPGSATSPRDDRRVALLLLPGGGACAAIWLIWKVADL
jgi:hypothetical protein